MSYEPALGPVDFGSWLGWDCEHCESCGDRYRDVWSTDDKTWLNVVGREGGLRCPDCFRFEASERGIAANVAINDEVPALDQIIVGGESGPGARPFDIAWARRVVAQCKEAGVPCFVKQLGARPLDGDCTRHLSDQGWPAAVKFRADHETLALCDRKGGDMAEWPEDLRVREFPDAQLSARQRTEEEGR